MQLIFDSDDIKTYIFLEDQNLGTFQRVDFKKTNEQINCDYAFEIHFNLAFVEKPEHVKDFLNSIELFLANNIHTIVVDLQVTSEKIIEKYIIPLQNIEGVRSIEKKGKIVIFLLPKTIDNKLICSKCGGSKVIFGEEKEGGLPPI